MKSKYQQELDQAMKSYQDLVNRISTLRDLVAKEQLQAELEVLQRLDISKDTNLLLIPKFDNFHILKCLMIEDIDTDKHSVSAIVTDYDYMDYEYFMKVFHKHITFSELCEISDDYSIVKLDDYQMEKLIVYLSTLKITNITRDNYVKLILETIKGGPKI